MNTEIINKNYLSRRQFMLLAICSGICTKISYLPMFISIMLGRDGIFEIMLLLLIEIITIILIYNISNKGGIKYCFSSLALKIITPFLFAIFFLKLVIYTASIINFITISMFDDVNWLFATLLLVPLLFYMGNKKAYIIGRFSEVFIWILFLTIAYHILFNDFDLKIDSLFPLLEHSPSQIFMKLPSFLWFAGDCFPLIFMGIKPRIKDTSVKALNFYLFLYFIGITVFFLIYYLLFANVSNSVPNAFHRVASFNKLSTELYGMDFLIIVSWTSNMVITLSLFAYGIIQGIKVFKPNFKFYLIPAILFIIIYIPLIENISVIYKVYVNGILSYFSISIFLATIIILAIIKTKGIKNYAFLNENQNSKEQNEKDKSA